MRQTTRTPRASVSKARSPLDMDISARLRSAQLLEKAATDLSKTDHDNTVDAEFSEALRHNRQIWSVLMGDSQRPNIAVNPIIKKEVPSLGSKVLAETRSLEHEKSPEAVQELARVNRRLASELQRSKAA